MKLHSYLRGSTGAALGIVAATLFIIFAIGAFFYYASSLIGGNHELNRASDAGILSVAKQALVQPAVALNDPQLLATNSCIIGNTLQTCPENSIPYSDFAAGTPGQTNSIADQYAANGSPAIDLITYNRCAAQAVLVGLEAQKINTTLALQRAQAVSWAVLGIGKVLQQRFATGGLNTYYDNAANLNTLDMLGGGSIISRIGNLQQGYVNPGRASNIYFYSDISYVGQSTPIAQIPQNMNAADPHPDQAKAQSADAWFPVGETVYYAQGYEPITLMPGTAQASVVSFIPVNPQGTPHAIDAKRVEVAATPPFNNSLAWVPPNAFQASAKASVNITGSARRPSDTYVDAISCAMVGCGDPLAGLGGILSGGGGPQDQAARIPAGFVRVNNLPGYEGLSVLPLGPVPGMAGASAAAFDGSNFVLNNSALGGGSKYLTFLTPPQGWPNSLVLNDLCFSNNDSSRSAIIAWANFNSSRVASTSPEYNLDVINGQHRDPNLDPFGYGKSAQYIAANQNPTFAGLRQGTHAGEVAQLNNLIYGGAYLNVDCSNLDGVTSLTDSKGHVFTAHELMDAVVDAAGANLGEGPPVPVDFTTPFSHRTWSWLEALKYNVIHTWVDHFDAGHYRISVPQLELETGMKYMNFWHADGSRVSMASPNKGGAQTSSQVMSVGTPYQLLNMINEQIVHKGGYHPDQVTYNFFITTLAERVRLINPKWSETDITNAMNSADLAPGSLMYLRDDGNGNLILASTCPQDTYIHTDTTMGDTGGINQIVPFYTQAGQYLDVAGTLINTAKNGSATAQTADAGLEKQPWTQTAGTIQYEQGAILYNSCGYNNLLGQIDLYSRPSTDVNVTFSRPN